MPRFIGHLWTVFSFSFRRGQVRGFLLRQMCDQSHPVLFVIFFQLQINSLMSLLASFTTPSPSLIIFGLGLGLVHLCMPQYTRQSTQQAAQKRTREVRPQRKIYKYLTELSTEPGRTSSLPLSKLMIIQLWPQAFRTEMWKELEQSYKQCQWGLAQPDSSEIDSLQLQRLPLAVASMLKGFGRPQSNVTLILRSCLRCSIEQDRTESNFSRTRPMILSLASSSKYYSTSSSIQNFSENS